MNLELMQMNQGVANLMGTSAVRKAGSLLGKREGMAMRASLLYATMVARFVDCYHFGVSTAFSSTLEVVPGRACCVFRVLPAPCIKHNRLTHAHYILTHFS